jgi:hypothetical protein
MAFPKVYLFAGDQYWRYDVAADAVDVGWPKQIAREWRRLPGAVGDALNAGNGKAYFFSGHEYRRFDLPIDRVDVGPLKTSEHWPGVPDLGIDATVRIGDGNVCFFHGLTCTRYSLALDRALDGYPRRIVDDWPGMPDAHVDASVNYGNGSIYFFGANTYTRFDLTKNAVDQPFQRIADQWHGMPDARVDAAMEWSDTDLMAACVPIYDPSFWNDEQDIRVINNCYNYACNRALQGFSNPGRGSGQEASLDSAADLNAGVVRDGLIPTDPDRPDCKGCQHQIMMFRMLNGFDFHFYQRNTDGLWSHKIGVLPASNLDGDGRRIVDPRTANRFAYAEYVGTYCVDRSLLRLG